MTDEQPKPGIGEGPARAISASLPEGTLIALRAAVGKRGVSAFITAAVEEQLRNTATAEYLAEYEREHGAFTPEEKRAVDTIWDQGREREASWRRTG